MCCGSKKKKIKAKSSVKKKLKNKDDLKQMHAIQNIEEGIEAMKTDDCPNFFSNFD